MNRGKLLHNFAAVALLIQHGLNAMNLAFDPLQALDELFFRFNILDFHCFNLVRFLAHGRGKGYPAQLNPPLEPQLLLDELTLPDLPDPKDAKVEIFL